MINGGSITVENFGDDFFEIIDKSKNNKCYCVLERVHAMPGQGVTSMFNMGENYGFIQGFLSANKIPFELITPQKWKREYGVTADKNTSIAVCQRLFPNVDLRRNPKCRVAHDGKAEALLIAEYGRRHYKGV